MSSLLPFPERPPSGGAKANPLPYLSFSRLQRYLRCPEEYRLHYIEGLRPREEPASLAFGRTIHQALAVFFESGEEPWSAFLRLWERFREATLGYKARESWQGLRESGERLLAKFFHGEARRLTAIHAVERPFELRVSTLPVPLVGIIDLVADLDGKRTVVDFKTSASTYPAHEALLSDQLAAGMLAEPEAEQAAFCVLLKTKEPRVEWRVAPPFSPARQEFLPKARVVAQAIARGEFFKRPSRWCATCAFLPVCLEDHETARRSLAPLQAGEAVAPTASSTPADDN